MEKSKPSFSSTFPKCDTFVTRLLISLRALPIARPSRALFLDILYCKYVHMYSSTALYTALLNLLHLYFAALSVLRFIETTTIVRTQFIIQDYLHVHLITKVPRINSALYFVLISDSARKNLLEDNLLTIVIAVLSNPIVKGISLFRLNFLGYLVVIISYALLSDLISRFYRSSTLVYINYSDNQLIDHRISS